MADDSRQYRDDYGFPSDTVFFSVNGHRFREYDPYTRTHRQPYGESLQESDRPQIADQAPEKPAAQPASVPEHPKAITLGHDLETHQPLTMSDRDRHGGGYVLGRSGTGKSTLLVNTMIQDVSNGHGVFFLDAHGDTITDLIRWGPIERLNTDLLILDPEDETHSFGLNLLRCRDITSRKERHDAYTRAHDVFRKLWQKEWDERPWLQLIVQYTLYVFLENQDYTLADVPLFLNDPAFRDYLVSRVTQNHKARYFWQNTFAAKPTIEQERQLDALRSRVSMLLGDDYVEQIIGQRETTIDFADIIAKRHIVLLKLSAKLSADVKNFIGTILISELLHAVRRRETIPAEQRHPFCIFVDEFQHFASYEDVATLFTEARKYGILTIVAHQDRSGQFADNKAILGATDAAVLKILLQPSVRDATEQAPEFAHLPPTETRLEQQLVPSQEPVADLLHGHTNVQVRDFVNAHLRPLQEDMEDTKAQMEWERLIRMDALDEAALYRIEERIEGLNRYAVDNQQQEKLQHALHALLRAQEQTVKLKTLQEQSRAQQLSLRALNHFFRTVLEGRVRAGQERFSDFLITRVRDAARVPHQYADVLALSIALLYGDPNTPRALSFAFAHTHGLFPQETASLAHQAAEQTRRDRQAFREQYVTKWLARWKETGADEKQRKHEEKLAELKKNYPYWRGGGPEMEFWTVPEIYTRFVWLQCYSSLRELLVPYYTARFRYPQIGNLKTIAASQKSLWDVPFPELIRNIGPYLHPGEETAERFHEYLRPSVVRQLEIFLTLHGEGAFVVQELLHAAERGGWQQYASLCEVLSKYKNTSMVSFPEIAGKDPLAILRLIKQINDFMHQNKNGCPELLAYFNHRAFIPITLKELVFRSLKVKTYGIEDPAKFIAELKRANIYPLFSPTSLNLEEELAQGRTDMHRLKTLLSEQWDGFSRQHPTAAAHWTRCDRLAQVYLIARACDLILFREVPHPAGCVANATFPLPAVPGAEAIVSALVSFSQETEARLQKAADEKELARHREWLEQECAKELTAIAVHPPKTLTPRVLSTEETAATLDACRKELSQSEPARVMLRVIADFVKFCELLSRPENLLLVPSRQYVAKQVYTRSPREMIDEEALTLLRLPKYTAAVKLTQERAGKQVVVQQTIQTLPPPEPHDPVICSALEQSALQRTHALYCKPRSAIDQELRQRLDAWRTAAQMPPPPGQF